MRKILPWKAILIYNDCIVSMKGRQNSIINMYHCKNCNLNFLVPLKTSGRAEQIKFVCPECKSRHWSHLW